MDNLHLVYVLLLVYLSGSFMSTLMNTYQLYFFHNRDLAGVDVYYHWLSHLYLN